MLISIKQLNNAGFEANIDHKRGTMEIHPQHPISIDWDMMREQFNEIGLTAYEVDSGLDAFHSEVEMHQIMRACRG